MIVLINVTWAVESKEKKVDGSDLIAFTPLVS